MGREFLERSMISSRFRKRNHVSEEESNAECDFPKDRKDALLFAAPQGVSKTSGIPKDPIGFRDGEEDFLRNSRWRQDFRRGIMLGKRRS